jgi:RHS repeat-associated protein
MGQPGAKKNDQIVSATPGDVHIIMVPSPGGPVPTPIPHPCASIINDGCAEKVKVMGQPGAVKSSKSKHTPPHIPMGPGPFQKPPKNEGKIVTGSANVFYEGKEAAMLGDTGEMCSDPSDTPVGKVMGTAATVLVGGGGSGSDEARAQASAQAMAAAAAACHAWINANMPNGPAREQAHRDLCSATGHPIDVATGKMFTRRVDLELPGRIPFAFVRNYSSARWDAGAFGVSWRHAYEAQIVAHRDFVAYRDENGRFLPFEPVAIGDSAFNTLAGLTLSRTARGYLVSNRQDETRHFPCASEPDDRALVIPLTAIEDRLGNRIGFEYAQGHLARIIDSAGRSIFVGCDDAGRIAELSLLASECPNGRRVVQRYRYDEGGRLVEALDALGHAYRYEYDGPLLVRETDRNGFSFYFSYDREGWCQETWGDGGLLYRRLEYDRTRRCTRVIDSHGHVQLYHWNDAGLVETQVDARGNRWSFEFDGDQKRVRSADPLGNAWTYAYDAAGNLALRVAPDGGAVAIASDALGRTTAQVDANGGVWSREYAASGLLAASIDPLGAAERYEWSERGDLASVSDASGRRAAFRYDDSGQLVACETASGAHFTRGYTATGLLREESDPLGPRVRLEYDELDRVVSRWRRGHGTTRFAHDREGNVTEIVDATGATTRLEYGGFNQVVRRVVSSGAGASEETLQDFDSENQLVRITYPGGRIAEIAYDADGQIAAKHLVDGRVTRYTRSDAGFVTEIAGDDGVVERLHLDAMGRVIERDAVDGERISYQYDPMGRLLLAENEHGAVAMSYDACGRVASEAGPNGELSHRYDALGRLLGSDLDGDFSHAIEIERNTQVLRCRGGDVRLEYAPSGHLARVQFPNGQFEEYRYAGTGHPSEIASNAGVTRYEYDERNRLRAIARPDGTRSAFERDGFGRLVASLRSDGASERYRYDEQGNRAREGSAFSFGAGNRLVRMGEETLVYDRSGRVVERRSARGIARYRYTARGSLREVTLGDRRVEYRYDAIGRRIAKVVDGAETRFAWEGSRLAHEWRPDGEERHYVYYPDSYVPLICYRRSEGSAWAPFYFHNDHRGCPVSLSDGRGNVVWRARVGAFGQLEHEQGELDQPFALPGQYRDAETGLVYNYHRYYAPELTIYLTPDPLGHNGGDQLYAYTSDPIAKVDPLGLSPHDYKGPAPLHGQIVEINGVQYVEFDAAFAFTSSSNINVGGSGDPATGSVDSMVSIGPNGEVVVQEGRHRAVAAAAGDPIPEDRGGIPGKPGWLRYPLGENGNFQTTPNTGPSLMDLAMDPASLAAARSGKRP